jgi:hypothetical protein
MNARRVRRCAPPRGASDGHRCGRRFCIETALPPRGRGAAGSAAQGWSCVPFPLQDPLRDSGGGHAFSPSGGPARVARVAPRSTRPKASIAFTWCVAALGTVVSAAASSPTVRGRSRWRRMVARWVPRSASREAGVGVSPVGRGGVGTGVGEIADLGPTPPRRRPRPPTWAQRSLPVGGVWTATGPSSSWAPGTGARRSRSWPSRTESSVGRCPWRRPPRLLVARCARKGWLFSQSASGVSASRGASGTRSRGFVADAASIDRRRGRRRRPAIAA